jgi:hypothetical protein
MMLTIQLPPEVEKRLQDRAAQSGLPVDVYAGKLIEQGLNGVIEAPLITAPESSSESAGTLNEILAPFRQEVQESGMTDDELRDLLTEIQAEVRAEKGKKKES